MKNIAIILSFLIVIPLWGQKVLILKSKNLAIYDKVVTGFLINAKVEADIVSLDSEKPEDVLTKINNYSLVFAIGNKALNTAVKQKSKPVIFSMVLNHKKFNVDKEKITGIKMKLSAKTQLGVISSLFSGNRVGIVQSNLKTEEEIDSYQQIASIFSLELVRIKVDSSNSLAKSLEKNKNKIDVLWMLPDKAILNPKSYNVLTKFAIQNNKPLYVLSGGLVGKGGLISLTPDYVSVGKQAALISNKVLTGNVPLKFIPITDPDSYTLVVNYSVANRIKILKKLAPKLLKFSATKGFPINAVE